MLKAKRGYSKGYYTKIGLPHGGKYHTYAQVEKVCERCGQTFTVRTARSKKVCYKCVEKVMQPKPCEVCGKTIYPSSSRTWKDFEKRRFCRSCRVHATRKEKECKS